MNAINFKVLSIKGTLLKEEVDMVVLPGYQGDISITLGEAERVFVNLLKTGIVYLFKSNKVYKRYFIFGGTFRVKEKDIILSTNNKIFDLDNLNIEEINAKIKIYEDIIKVETKDEVISYYKKLHEDYNSLIKAKDVNYY